MIFIDLSKICLILLLCVYASVSDIKNNTVKNKWIAIFLLTGLAILIPEFIIFKTDIVYRLVNVAIINSVSVILYLTRIWAGADCKLVAAISVLVPYSCFLDFINNYFCLSFILVFAFGISFFALIADSVIIKVRSKEKIQKKKVARSLALFAYRYFSTMAYISVANELIVRFIKDPKLLIYVMIAVNLGIVLLVSFVKPLLKPFIVIPVFIAAVVLKIVFHNPLFTVRTILVYLSVLFISALRILINEFNYENIPAEDVKKGMVLSFQTTLLFASSNVKGLPRISKENMKDRITEEEAESIIRWSKTKEGCETVTIVRKMPFAIFISIGTVVFIVLGFLL